MGSDNRPVRREDAFTIESDFHRLFAVFKDKGVAVKERLPVGINQWPQDQRQRYLLKVIDRLKRLMDIKQEMLKDSKLIVH